MNDRNLSIATELCYAGVTAPNALNDLTAFLCELVGAEAGDIVEENSLSGEIRTFGSHGFDPVFLDTYDEDHLGRNPWFENLARHPRDRFHTDEIDPPDFWKSSYYNEWVRPQGLHHTIGAALEVGHGQHAWAGFCRRTGASPFDSEAEFLTPLLPHLRRAVQLRRKFVEAEAESAQFSSVIDALTAPVVLLDRQRRLHYANPAAETFLEGCGALKVTGNGHLIAVSGRGDASLGAAIRSAADTFEAPESPPPSPVVLRCGHGKTVALIAFRAAGHAVRAPDSAVIAVVFRELETASEVDVRGFAKAFQLTRTEADLATWIASGGNLPDFAELHGIAVATARWHLKNLEQKTGNSRIEHLVAAIHSTQFPVG